MKYLDSREPDADKAPLYAEGRERTPEGLVGLSLSLCVNAILEGIVDYEELKAIVSATSFPLEGPNAADNIVTRYGSGYWSQDLEGARKIVERLLADGKLLQRGLVFDNTDEKQFNQWIKAEDLAKWIEDYAEVNADRLPDLDRDLVRAKLTGLLGEVLV
jgi:hypothetical protein